MSFITYSLSFYENELNAIEHNIVTNKSIYRAKQLLKMLDDLVDEGYTELYEMLEQTQNGVSRLKKYIDDNHAKPFALHSKIISTDINTYGTENIELAKAINVIYKRAEETSVVSNDAFIQRLRAFCDWVGYEEDTAYIFLLRDTLLPYVFYLSKERKYIYPWLLSRQSLAFISGNTYIDDELRDKIICALEQNAPRSFEEFSRRVLPDMINVLCNYPSLEKALTDLLNDIQQKRIIVVESGCSGTFPLLLMSLDNRIDMRMYTTYPYLLDIYKDKVFTEKYEKARLFETLYSQDLYLRFADFQNKKFFVNISNNAEIEENTLSEIKAMIQKQKKQNSI